MIVNNATYDKMKNEIIEGNILIANFSDPTWKDRVDLSWEDIEDYLPYYHKFWDYLMPVIDKIYSSNEYYQYKEEVSRQFETGTYINPKFIEATWGDVVEFIKWHNNQNKVI